QEQEYRTSRDNIQWCLGRAEDGLETILKLDTGQSSSDSAQRDNLNKVRNELLASIKDLPVLGVITESRSLRDRTTFYPGDYIRIFENDESNKILLYDPGDRNSPRAKNLTTQLRAGLGSD